MKWIAKVDPKLNKADIALGRPYISSSTLFVTFYLSKWSDVRRYNTHYVAWVCAIFNRVLGGHSVILYHFLSSGLLLCFKYVHIFDLSDSLRVVCPNLANELYEYNRTHILNLNLHFWKIYRKYIITGKNNGINTTAICRLGLYRIVILNHLIVLLG